MVKKKFINGNCDDGNWIDGKKFGKAFMIYNNGDKIVGKWINDKLEWYGIMKYNNFERYWKNNLKEGEGNLKSKNEDEYIGLWKDDILIEGKVKYKNGDFYKGNLYQKNKNGNIKI